MRLSVALVPGVALCLLGVATLADRALVGRSAALRSNAALRIEEDARQAADSVGLALVRLEQAAAAGRETDGVRVERLAARPRRAIPPIGFRSYAERSRSELIALLSSEGVTPNGLPEAVVARIALGPAAPVSGPVARSVEDRLLDGRLPVAPGDLAVLGRELGMVEDPRLATLEARLRRSPAARDLPLAPAFAREMAVGGPIEGWARTSDGHTLRYEMPVSALLAAAAVERGEVTELSRLGPRQSELSRVVSVPGVPGLRLRFEPRRSPDSSSRRFARRCGSPRSSVSSPWWASRAPEPGRPTPWPTSVRSSRASPTSCARLSPLCAPWGRRWRPAGGSRWSTGSSWPGRPSGWSGSSSRS